MSSNELTPGFLLAHVFRQARLLVGESPEQVGRSVRVAGKTIRRLEEAEVTRPRELTLSVLARYYALNVAFIRWLAHRDVNGQDLRDALRSWASERGIRADGSDDSELALRLARQRDPAAPQRESDPAVDLQRDYRRLNERRRRMLLQFAHELRLAQSEETRRRSDATLTTAASAASPGGASVLGSGQDE